MKWIVEDSLSNFPFWGGAKDTVEGLTEEQINAFGDFLEQNGSEDTVYTDTEINDMFGMTVIMFIPSLVGLGTQRYSRSPTQMEEV